MRRNTALQIVVRSEMLRQSLTWIRLAEACESTPSVLHRRVGIDVPTMKTIEMVADALDMDPDDLCDAIAAEAKYADDEGRRLRGDGMIQGHGRPE